MSTSKNKLLVIIMVILLLTNIALIAFILFNKPEEKRSGRADREAMMVEFLQKEVGFDKQQMQQYDTLNKQHKEKMKLRFDDIRSNKQKVYQAVGSQAFSDSSINDAAIKLSAPQKDIETNMLQHFAAIRRICTPEQQPKFDSLIYKIWNKMGDRKKKQE